MPVVPNALERFVVLRLNRSPGAMLDVFAAAGLDAVGVALELGIFDALEDRPGSAGALAARLDADKHGVETLLGVLHSGGYVERTAGTYRLSRLSERWVVPGSPESFAPYLRFWREVVLPFCREHAAEAVRDGSPSVTVYEWLDNHPGRWPLAQRAFETAARVVMDDFVDAVAPRDGYRVLDVGGGHGLYSIECCRAADDVTATVVDAPAALDVAEANVAAAGLEGRVSLVGGDYFEADLGDGYDLTLVCNVVHAHDAAETLALFERVHDALAPGGRVAVLDQFDTGSRLPLAKTATRFIDYTYLATLGGSVHEENEVRALLGEAGFGGASKTAFRAAGSTLLVARR